MAKAIKKGATKELASIDNKHDSESDEGELYALDDTKEFDLSDVDVDMLR